MSVGQTRTTSMHAYTYHTPILDYRSRLRYQCLCAETVTLLSVATSSKQNVRCLASSNSILFRRARKRSTPINDTRLQTCITIAATGAMQFLRAASHVVTHTDALEF